MGTAAAIIGVCGFLAMAVGAFVGVLYDQGVGGIVAIAGYCAAALGFFLPYIT